MSSNQQKDQQKGIASFYGYLGKTRPSIGDPILRLPGDWGELKELLIERMIIVHVQHHQNTCIMALDKHLSGKFLYSSKRGYGQSRTRWRREVLGMWKLAYNYKTNRLTIGKASFGWELMDVAQEFWLLERGIQFKTPQLIPQELKHPDFTLIQPAPPRYADYSKQPRPQYEERPRGGYPAANPLHVCHYLPKNLRMREAVR